MVSDPVVANMLQYTIEIWGSEDASERFLLTPHPLLHGQMPLWVAVKSTKGVQGRSGDIRSTKGRHRGIAVRQRVALERDCFISDHIPR
jgi:hypothetical protein